MTPAVPALAMPPVPLYCVIMLDGRILGYVRADRAPNIVARLRSIKAAALSRLQPLPAGAKVSTIQVCNAPSSKLRHLQPGSSASVVISYHAFHLIWTCLLLGHQLVNISFDSTA